MPHVAVISRSFARSSQHQFHPLFSPPRQAYAKPDFGFDFDFIKPYTFQLCVSSRLFYTFLHPLLSLGSLRSQMRFLCAARHECKLIFPRPPQRELGLFNIAALLLLGCACGGDSPTHYLYLAARFSHDQLIDVLLNIRNFEIFSMTRRPSPLSRFTGLG